MNDIGPQHKINNTKIGMKKFTEQNIGHIKP